MLPELFDCRMKDGLATKCALIKLFVMGENVWHEENEWPIDYAQYKQYFLHGDNAL
jgi:predicted acyl esterase